MSDSTPIRFQISLDAESVMISPAPQGGKARVIISHLDKGGLRQLARSIAHADLQLQFNELVEAELRSDTIDD